MKPRNLASQDQALAYLRAAATPVPTTEVIKATFTHPCRCPGQHAWSHTDYSNGANALRRLERAGLITKIIPNRSTDRNVYWSAEPPDVGDLEQLLQSSES